MITINQGKSYQRLNRNTIYTTKIINKKKRKKKKKKIK